MKNYNWYLKIDDDEPLTDYYLKKGKYIPHNCDELNDKIMNDNNFNFI